MYSLGTALQQRQAAIAARRASSIEVNGYKNTNSIELPPEVDDLIDNKAFRPRYKKLMREYPRELLALAKAARDQQKPSHWFAKCCAVRNWDRTLKFVTKLIQVWETAERVAGKLGTSVTRFIYKQIWRGINVERWADTARETGRHKGKYFVWLCKREATA